MRALAAFVSCVALLSCPPSVQADWVLNGDFATPGAGPEPFFAWSTFDAGVSNARPTAGAGTAVFTEDPAFAGVQLEQAVDLPVGVRLLSFEYRLTSVPDATAGAPAPDSFQATLYTAGLLGSVAPSNPLLPNQFPAFYSVDAVATGGEFLDPAFVTTATTADGWRRVSLDLTALGASPGLLLEFRLNGADDGQLTTVELRDVRGLAEDVPTAPVPAPAGLVALAPLASGLLARRWWLAVRPNR